MSLTRRAEASRSRKAVLAANSLGFFLIEEHVNIVERKYCSTTDKFHLGTVTTGRGLSSLKTENSRLIIGSAVKDRLIIVHTEFIAALYPLIEEHDSFLSSNKYNKKSATCVTGAVTGSKFRS